MIDQGPVKAPESESIRESIGLMIHDLMELLELQGRLFENDTREVMQRIARPLLVFAAGVVLFAVAVPIGLLAIAEGLVAWGAPRAAAYSLVATASLLVAVGMAVWARQRFRRGPSAYARSREELAHSMSWIKASMNKLDRQRSHPRSDVNDLHSY